MSVIGTIQAFNEADNVGAAVESLFAAGCDRVVVVDGAWGNSDGSLFGDADSHLSSDGTGEAARAAGAELVEPDYPFWGGDGSKRDFLLKAAGAAEGDHLILLDADERLEGRVTTSEAPSGHGCIVLRNDKANDLEQLRTPWLDRDVRASVPLLRWFRWSPTLRCVKPGRYLDGGQAVSVYLVDALARRNEQRDLDELDSAALAALRSVETLLPNDRLVVLPIVPHLSISHAVEAAPARVDAKRRYYEAVPA